MRAINNNLLSQLILTNGLINMEVFIKRNWTKTYLKGNM